MENQPSAINPIYLHRFYGRRQIDNTRRERIRPRCYKQITYLSRSGACNDLITYNTSEWRGATARQVNPRRFSHICTKRRRERTLKTGSGEESKLVAQDCCQFWKRLMFRMWCLQIRWDFLTCFMGWRTLEGNLKYGGNQLSKFKSIKYNLFFRSSTKMGSFNLTNLNTKTLQWIRLKHNTKKNTKLVLCK